MTLLNFACRHRHASGFELNVEFQAAERVTCLFGPSGSGKTSVLSLIAGFLTPQAGTIRFNGRTLADTAAHVQLRPEARRIGFVFQDHVLFPHLTVDANLRYGARRRSDSKRTIDFDRVAKVLELTGLLQRSPQNLSGGERQRVALGRALLSRPDLLLLDEPWASLDDALRGKVLTCIERVVHEWDLPTLFVSHDQASVRRLADWVVILDRGRVITAGKPDDALGRPDVLDWQNSAGPMNLLRIDHVRRQDAHWVGEVGEQTLSLPALEAEPAGPLFVEFSPRDVTVCAHDVAGVSARNHLRGIVRRTVDTPRGLFVAVDIGQILWADVTREAAVELGIAAGCEVVCLVKTVALRPLG